MITIKEDLAALLENNEIFTDVLIPQGEEVMVKMPSGWRVVEGCGPYTVDEMMDMLMFLDNDCEEKIRSGIHRTFTLNGWRLRVNAYLASAGTRPTLSIRRIHMEPIPFAQTGLPSSVHLMTQVSRGLILVSGATGSGKSTTIAALVDSINAERDVHIVTVEDPIEYVYERRRAVFSQREVGVDVDSFFSGVRDALRQRPDVIVIGEIRDRETADAALLAGESGHLVIGSLHANSAVSTISKILSFFNGNERESKAQALSSSLVGVISQLLLPAEHHGGVVLASEQLFNHKGQIAKYIADLDLDKVQVSLSNKEDGVSRPMVDSMFDLIAQKKVSHVNALKAASQLDESTLYERLKGLRSPARPSGTEGNPGQSR